MSIRGRVWRMRVIARAIWGYLSGTEVLHLGSMWLVRSSMLNGAWVMRDRIRRISWVRHAVRHASGVVSIRSHWHGIHHALALGCRVVMYWLIIAL